eukprot:4452370-Prymnesium_polylepis.1
MPASSHELSDAGCEAICSRTLSTSPRFAAASSGIDSCCSAFATRRSILPRGAPSRPTSSTDAFHDSSDRVMKRSSRSACANASPRSLSCSRIFPRPTSAAPPWPRSGAAVSPRGGPRCSSANLSRCSSASFPRSASSK